MMASRVLGLLGLVLIVAAVGANASTYNVLDKLGWTIPPAGDVAYKTWAAEKSFKVGDTVVFNWTGTHNVAEVSKADFDTCTGTSPIGTIHMVSPYSVELSSDGPRYFICTVGKHCSFGQKVTLSIGSASSPAAEPPSSPPAGSASSLAVGALSSFALSALAFALLIHS
ncbi:hypothetical protein BT93_K1289 [Corymbia citriodora subsp. variegata]|nr:hypothetical protein BT93_K1289 [Corymbia citriodora subsp. variegata]